MGGGKKNNKAGKNKTVCSKTQIFAWLTFLEIKVFTSIKSEVSGSPLGELLPERRQWNFLPEQTQLNAPRGFCLEGRETWIFFFLEAETIRCSKIDRLTRSYLAGSTSISSLITALVAFVNTGGLWQVQSSQNLLPLSQLTTANTSESEGSVMHPEASQVSKIAHRRAKANGVKNNHS